MSQSVASFRNAYINWRTRGHLVCVLGLLSFAFYVWKFVWNVVVGFVNCRPGMWLTFLDSQSVSKSLLGSFWRYQFRSRRCEIFVCDGKKREIGVIITLPVDAFLSAKTFCKRRQLASSELRQASTVLVCSWKGNYFKLIFHLIDFKILNSINTFHLLPCQVLFIAKKMLMVKCCPWSGNNFVTLSYLLRKLHAKKLLVFCVAASAYLARYWES